MADDLLMRSCMQYEALIVGCLLIKPDLASSPQFLAIKPENMVSETCACIAKLFQVYPTDSSALLLSAAKTSCECFDSEILMAGLQRCWYWYLDYYIYRWRKVLAIVRRRRNALRVLTEIDSKAEEWCSEFV